MTDAKKATGPKVQDASSSNEAVIDKPATQDPAAEKLLDKAMTPNQPPPIDHGDGGKDAGREHALDQQRAVDEAVREANADQLPKLGGNTWDTQAEAPNEMDADQGKGSKS